jgi:hypothetical protein
MIDGQPQGGGDFRAVLAQAKEIDQAAEDILTGGEKKETAPVEGIDPAEAWAAIPMQVGALLAIAAPELKAVYTPKACMDWGRDMHRLATKRGWSAEGLPPEVAAGISTAGLLLPTLFVLKTKRDAMRRARQAQAQAGGEGAAAGVIPEGQGLPDGNAGA